MKRFAQSRPFWWILIAIAVAVVVGMTTLIIMTGGRNGNWFTVLGSACIVTVSVVMLRALKKTEDDGRPL